MSRRARAVAFACAAALCAGLAASATGGYGPGVEASLGELAPVLVSTRTLPAKRAITARAARESVEERRVPVRFLPPGVLSSTDQLIGREPVAAVAPGSYLLAGQLRLPGERADPRGRLEPGRRPVEIAVESAGSLAVGGHAVRRVDVVITSEPGPGGGPGRTYVAASAVELLALHETTGAGGTDVVPGPQTGNWVATLALTRAEALRLIQAESFARSVRLLAR